MGNSIDAGNALTSLGHTPSPIEEADVIIVNTCAVTEKTERKIVKRLRQLQGDHLIIAGCLPVAVPASLEQISCLRRMGPLNKTTINEIADYLGIMFSGNPSHENHITARPNPDNLCGIINIAEGCLGKCSYCIVRRARGKMVSRDPEDVEKRARSMIESGTVELQLAAQDTASYGQDIGSSLPELLNRITEIPGRFMVRVGMMNPNTAQPILSELTDSLKCPKVYRFLHMPVQSGSDEVLEKMHRGYKAGDYIETVRLLREKLPEISFATDVIAGFPGETDEDFEKTLKLMELTRPDKINVTRYSKRPQTHAAELYDMPDRIKKERSRRLTKLWLDIASENNRIYLETVLKVLVTENGRGKTMKGRTQNYTGVVIVGDPPLGSQQTVKIVNTGPFYLTATTTIPRS